MNPSPKQLEAPALKRIYNKNGIVDIGPLLVVTIGIGGEGVYFEHYTLYLLIRYYYH